MRNLIEDEHAGGKLIGLSSLPRTWVPRFFGISPELHRRYLKSDRSQSGIIYLLTESENFELRQKLSDFGVQPADVSLIVRSNSMLEGLTERGMFRSVRSDGTVEGVLRAAWQVFSAAPPDCAPLGLIVQEYVTPVCWGFLSNERRVSDELRRWTCELNGSHEPTTAQLPSVFPLRAERAKAAPETALRCFSKRDLIAQLRNVARTFYLKNERRHLEWAWDGQRLWIVQCDLAPDEPGRNPEPRIPAGAGPVDPRRLRLFRPVRMRDARRWQKLQCVEVFRKAGLPTTALFVLEGASNVRRLADGKSPAGLTADLRELTKSALVVRTDVAGKTTLLAPRTDTVSSAKDALRFLQHAARALLAHGATANGVCFIAHRFIPALASAFSFADPNNSRVLIDGLWGLPDGLEFCPHDSFEVNARTGAQLTRRIRYKPSFLASRADGRWRVERLVPPWDWRPSLVELDLRTIATASAQLSKIVRRPVVTMWFVGVPPESGHPHLIPWRYTTEDTPRHIESAVKSHFRIEPFIVSNDTDLNRLEARADPISAVVFRPDGAHLRNEGFLQRLGRIVSARGLRLEMEGSSLSHAFYVLSRTGAQVACVDPMNPRTITRYFRKLVRDRIPVQIQHHGERAQTVSLPAEELVDVLKAKIVEEALEVLRANTTVALREEMADVYEVLLALCDAIRSPRKQLAADAERKRRKVGGFEKGIVLVETEDTPLVAVRTGPGLFESVTARKKTQTPTEVVAAGRRPKTQQDRLLIPLIPSAPSRLRGATIITVRSVGLTFRIDYKDKHVEVIVGREHLQKTNRDQLPLPLDEPNASGA